MTDILGSTISIPKALSSPSPFSRWEIWSRERLSHLQRSHSRARIHTQAVWLQGPCSNPGLGKLKPTGSSNLTCYLFLYSLKAKKGFYIFKQLENKIRTRISCDMWKLYASQISVSINKASLDIATVIYVLSGCFKCNCRVVWLPQGPYGLQGPKCFLPGPSEWGSISRLMNWVVDGGEEGYGHSAGCREAQECSSRWHRMETIRWVLDTTL